MKERADPGHVLIRVRSCNHTFLTRTAWHENGVRNDSEGDFRRDKRGSDPLNLNTGVALRQPRAPSQRTNLIPAASLCGSLFVGALCGGLSHEPAAGFVTDL